MSRESDHLLSDLSLGHLSRTVVGRNNSFLKNSMRDHTALLHKEYSGQRILVLGGAGFIARQVLREILQLRPAYVGIVDLSENGLAEVMRSIRATGAVLPGTTVEPWLVDIGSPQFVRMVREVGHVDRLLNFAAVKHVRSERDVPSLLRMLEVNILSTYRATLCVAEAHPQAAQFIVSTDKAADPANFMGASKRAMELVAVGACSSVTMARFANVAFSSGSLLESWLRRISNRSPISVPKDTWRYFVTPEEAGHICILASIAPSSSIILPQLGVENLVELEKAMFLVLAECGFEPVHVNDIASGIAFLDSSSPQTCVSYPVLVSERDTHGEKRAEQFLATGERSERWIEGLDRIGRHRTTLGESEMSAFVTRIADLVSDPITPLSTDDLVRWMQDAVPTFKRSRALSRLDDRA